jgi:hypothetical protein
MIASVCCSAGQGQAEDCSANNKELLVLYEVQKKLLAGLDGFHGLIKAHNVGFTIQYLGMQVSFAILGFSV